MTISARRASATTSPMIPSPAVIVSARSCSGDLAAADDRAERPAVRLGEEDGARARAEQAHARARRSLEDRRRIERRRDLATDVGQGRHLVGAAMRSRGTAARSGSRRRRSRRSSSAVGRRPSPKRPSCSVLWTLITPIASLAERGSGRRGTTSPACRRRGCRSPLEVGRPVEQQRFARSRGSATSGPSPSGSGCLGLDARRPRCSTGTSIWPAPGVEERDVDDVGLRRCRGSARRRARSARRGRAARPIAWPTLLTIASSATRWRVSSISRAFSSATLRLAASVVSRRTSPSLKAFSRSRFWSEMTPRDLVRRRPAARRRTTWPARPAARARPGPISIDALDRRPR